jgi:hypothetical protein
MEAGYNDKQPFLCTKRYIAVLAVPLSPSSSLLSPATAAAAAKCLSVFSQLVFFRSLSLPLSLYRAGEILYDHNRREPSGFSSFSLPIYSSQFVLGSVSVLSVCVVELFYSQSSV